MAAVDPYARTIRQAAHDAVRALLSTEPDSPEGSAALREVKAWLARLRTGGREDAVMKQHRPRILAVARVEIQVGAGIFVGRMYPTPGWWAERNSDPSQTLPRVLREELSATGSMRECVHVRSKRSRGRSRQGAADLRSAAARRLGAAVLQAGVRRSSCSAWTTRTTW